MVDKAHYHGLVRRDIFPLLPKEPGRVLDLGGGYGLTSAAIKKERGGRAAVVVDLFADPAGVDPAVDAFEKGDVNDVDFCASLRDRHGSFDTILCLDVLEHIPDPWSTMKALTSLLAPGGCVVASIPNVNHVSVLIPLLLRGEWTLRDSGILDRTHLRFFVKKTAIELMTCSGLRIAQSDIAHHWRWKKWRLPHRMPVGERFVAIQYLFRAVRPAGA